LVACFRVRPPAALMIAGMLRLAGVVAEQTDSSVSRTGATSRPRPPRNDITVRYRARPPSECGRDLAAAGIRIFSNTGRLSDEKQRLTVLAGWPFST
jgi:hypothetical protein